MVRLLNRVHALDIQQFSAVNIQITDGGVR